MKEIETLINMVKYLIQQAKDDVSENDDEYYKGRLDACIQILTILESQDKQ